MFRTCGTIMRLPFPLPNSCVCLPCLLMKYSWLYDRPHCLVLGIRAVPSSKKATKPAKVSDQMRIGMQTAPVRHGQYICHIADTDQYLTNAVARQQSAFPTCPLHYLHHHTHHYITSAMRADAGKPWQTALGRRKKMLHSCCTTYRTRRLLEHVYRPPTNSQDHCFMILVRSLTLAVDDCICHSNCTSSHAKTQKRLVRLHA